MNNNASTWQANRRAALERLGAFSNSNATAYAQVRNLDQGIGNHTGVSRLSPWISHRALLETEVISTISSDHSVRSTQKFIQEVFWRGYWKGWLEHRPAVWPEYQTSVDKALLDMQASPRTRTTYEQATLGTTHIALFNDWVEELTTTGYLHNHARMWFASIWIFTLRLPWQLGADFFYRHLLDGDAAVNTLSWRWVAGLHTKGKVYAATHENILRNARERGTKYSAGLTDLAQQPAPLDEKPSWPTQPQQLTLPTDTQPLQNPCVLVLHEDDLGYGLPKGLTIAATVALTPQARSGLNTLPLVESFSHQLLQEAVEHHPHHSTTPLTVPAIVDAVKRSGASVVITPFAPVGPTNDALSKLDKLLAAENITFGRIVQQYDRLVWPHTSKGFFGLNKKIPSLLNVLTGDGPQGNLFEP